MEEEESPADFICPITTEVMSDPVMAADGHAYERTGDRALARDQVNEPDDRRGARVHRALLAPHAAQADPRVGRGACRTVGLCFFVEEEGFEWRGEGWRTRRPRARSKGAGASSNLTATLRRV